MDYDTNLTIRLLVFISNKFWSKLLFMNQICFIKILIPIIKYFENFIHIRQITLSRFQFFN